VKDDTNGKVDEERLRAVVAAYGANRERWPERERAAAELAARSSEGALLLEGEARLDAWLNIAPEVVPSDELLRRVREIPLRHAMPAKGAWWPLGKVRHLVTAVAAAAVFGVIVGVASPEKADGGDDDAAWEDLSSLALGLDFPEETP
jgi:hypothetical protein